MSRWSTCQVTGDDMAAFLGRPEVKAVLPGSGQGRGLDPTDFEFFKGRFPCSLAGRYFGDRYVLVGDAAGLVRAFKGKGVTSAVMTGIRAAEAIFYAGITEAALKDHYARANQDITGDLMYGQSMRQLVRVSARLGLMTPCFALPARVRRFARHCSAQSQATCLIAKSIVICCTGTRSSRSFAPWLPQCLANATRAKNSPRRASSMPSARDDARPVKSGQES